MAASVSVKGGRELVSSMHAAMDQLADMHTTHARAGEYLVQRAQGLAPKRSGRLAGSIKAAPGAAAVLVTAGGPGVPYAGPIHWGWAARGIRAHPFLTDALAQAETSVVDIYSDAVDTIVGTIHGK